MPSRKKAKKKKIEGECYFCNQNLERVEQPYKARLSCCYLVAHKHELYKWFLQNQHCPNCLVVSKQERAKIVQWGMNRDRASTKHAKTKPLEKKSKRTRVYEKRLRK